MITKKLHFLTKTVAGNVGLCVSYHGYEYSPH